MLRKISQPEKLSDGPNISVKIKKIALLVMSKEEDGFTSRSPFLIH